jgi:hypothetical protein
MKALSLLLALAVGWLSGPLLEAYTTDSTGIYHYTDGTLADCQNAINAATGSATPQNYIVEIPAGSWTWFASGAYLLINQNVSVLGQGSGSTTITVSSTSPPTAGCVRISAAAVFGNLTWVPYSTGSTVVNWTTQTVNGWRITGVNYNPGSLTCDAYVLFCNPVAVATWGLLDNSTINSGNASGENIFAYGPPASWQEPDSFGTYATICVESCRFTGPGYVCDMNANSRATFRNLVITGNMKIDGHGVCTNTPPRGCRQIEGYMIDWQLTTATSYPAIEQRSGTGRWFNIQTEQPNVNYAALYLTDYGYQQQGSSFNYVWQTLNNYPIYDQIGKGEDVGGVPYSSAAASDPLYVWNATRNGGLWARLPKSVSGGHTITTNTAGYAIGTGGVGSPITLATVSSIIYAGDVISIPGDNNRYTVLSQVGVTNAQNPTQPLTISPALGTAIPASAVSITDSPISLYQGQTGNSSATFTEPQIIEQQRDYFIPLSGTFDGGGVNGGGVGTGTYASMMAITPTLTGVGYWVTDRGTWNQSAQGTSGELYVWNGSAWVLNYIPYQYPHPMIAGRPVPSAATGGRYACLVYTP